MILKWWGASDSSADIENFLESGTPLWTIDIYVYLRAVGVDRAVMFTSVLGVNPSHYVSR
jgi:hypothetical protein